MANCLVLLALCLSAYVGIAFTDCLNCFAIGQRCEDDCGRSNTTANIACPSVPLPTNQCVVAEEGLCIDNQTYIGATVSPEPYWISCCNKLLCADSKGYSIGVSVTFGYSWIAVNSTIATLEMNWTPGSFVEGYQLTINETDIQQIVRCMCLPSAVVKYRVNVSLLAGTSMDIHIITLPYPNSVLSGHVTTNSFPVKLPTSCWGTEGASLEKCGPRLPSAPQNLAIFQSLNNKMGNVIVLTIMWRRQNCQSSTEAYKIEIDNHGAPALHCNRTFPIIYSAPTNEMSAENQTFIVQCNPTTPGIHQYTLGMYASCGHVENPMQQQSCEQCRNNVSDCQVYCWGPPTHVPFEVGVAASTHSNKSLIVLIIIVISVVLLVLVVVSLIALLIIAHSRRHKTLDHCIPLVVDGGVGRRQVFVINSPQSSEEDLCLVRHLCHKLADNSVMPVNYDYLSFDRQQGPGHSGIYQWAENTFASSDMILFICNKHFCDAWNNGDTEYTSIISASKLLLQGYLSTSEDLSQFGIVILRDGDDKYIPSLYLKSVKKFVPFHDNDCHIEDLLDTISSM